jgi:hypothetical protein
MAAIWVESGGEESAFVIAGPSEATCRYAAIRNDELRAKMR